MLFPVSSGGAASYREDQRVHHYWRGDERFSVMRVLFRGDLPDFPVPEWREPTLHQGREIKKDQRKIELSRKTSAAQITYR
jgi:hypothetical protein